MKNLFKPIIRWWSLFIDIITPTNQEIKSATRALWIIAIIIWAASIIISLTRIGDIYISLLYIGIFVIAILTARLAALVINKINSIPKNIKLALLTILPILLTAFSFSFFIPLLLIIVSVITGASVICLKKQIFKKLSLGQKIIRIAGLLVGFAGIIYGIYFYSIDGYKDKLIVNASAKTNIDKKLTVDNPSTPGEYDVDVLYYGSGKDKHRDIFSNEVDIKTESVDGTAFIDNWKGFGGWYRTLYWGFDYKELPLNARVWYPAQQGKFPLVLVVHGNHGMQDYSDGGYEYLGELLASRGYIVASIDENFLNGSWSDIFGGLENENDARAWLLLEHLKVWHNWNNDSSNVFYNKVDINNICLIGHSRGGEAVAHAACFNRLPYYPDDADTKLDYNFNIRSVIAIAPCDGQYKPANKRTSLNNIDYFVIHGAQDSDVKSYMGSRQYERIKLTDSTYHFKTGLYIYGANHGQFNTSWGRNDTGTTFARLLNLKQIMKAEDQRQIAKVYISSFLETTLKKNYSYLPLFMDYRTANEWLPETIYLNQFQDSNSEFICTFDEDINIKSHKFDNNAISGKNLTVWKEKLVNLIWGNKDTRATYLGWNNKKDSTKIASYSIDLKNSKIKTDSSSVLIFSMSDTGGDSNPKSHGKWVKKNNKEKENSKQKNDKTENKKEEIAKEKGKVKKDTTKGKAPIDFTISISDDKGNKITFPLKKFSYLQPKIKVKLMKTDYISGDTKSENIFQTFRFPMRDFYEENKEFNFKSIKNISFIFNKSKKGVVIIDNIGFSKSL